MKIMPSMKFLSYGVLWLLCTGYLLSAIYYSGATHRDSPTIREFGLRNDSCAIDEIGMHNVEPKTQDFRVSPFLLEGTWDFVADGINPTTGQVNLSKDTIVFSDPDDTGPMSLTVPVRIDPGQNLLNFEMTDFRGSCVRTYEVTGISVGEPFEIRGPCEVEVNTTVFFSLILQGDDQPFSVITSPDPASELKVSRDQGKGSFVLHQFEFQGENVPSGDRVGIANGGTLEIKFLDPGLYQLEVIWNMLEHPNGANIVEVGRAKVKVDVLPAGSPVTGLGLACAPIFNQITGKVCDEESVENVLAMPGAGATVRCKLHEGFAADELSVNVDEERDFAANIVPSASQLDLDQALGHLVDCSIEHEREHVKQLNKDFPHACDGCCCWQTPPELKDLGVTKAQCVANETLAYGRENDCLTDKINSLTTLPPGVKDILKAVRKDNKKRINLNNFPNCKNLA